MKLWRALLVIPFMATGAPACDLCGCFTPQLDTALPLQVMSPSDWWRGFYTGAAEQFTRYATLQFEGDEVANPTGQYLNSSITQIFAGYGIANRLAVQVNLPIVYRDFKRPEGFRIDRGTESGIGDMSILLKGVAFRYSLGGGRDVDFSGKNPVMVQREPDFTVSLALLAGLKLPTGDTSRIKEEFNEIEIPDAPESGIHGHDLTLGTGSFDGMFGVITSMRYRNFFAEANLQYMLRGDGDYDYNFADDLTCDLGAGYYFIRNSTTVVGLELLASGEHKERDHFRGQIAEDTGMTAWFLGPRLVAAHGRWSAQLDVDLPVAIDNTALQAVADYRLRGGISFHF